MTAEERNRFDVGFGERVADARKRVHVSQRGLSDLLSRHGVSLDSAALSRLETGQRAPKLEEALAIADALSVPLSELLPVDLEPATQVARNWAAVRRELESARYVLGNLAAQLDYFASSVEAHPDAAAEAFGVDRSDWRALVYDALASDEARTDPLKVATRERYEQLRAVLEAVTVDVLSLKTGPPAAIALQDPEFESDDYAHGGLIGVVDPRGGDDGEHQATP